jgi:hypothetical protein
MGGHTMSEELTHIYHCRLSLRTEDADYVAAGHWESATCAEYSKAIADAGGMRALSVYSALTDPEGTRGPAIVFTEWGTKEGHTPVAASGGPNWTNPCSHHHAVFVADGQALTCQEGEGK